VKLKKELGQNFLTDKKVIKDLLQTAGIGSDDLVLEIGAGSGALTRPLAKRAGRVVAVEIDSAFIPKLQESLKGLENVTVVNDDILKMDIDNRIRGYFRGADEKRRFLSGAKGSYKDTKIFKVVGSIPYQITSPLIHQLLNLKSRPKSITIVVQKEVAEKITAKPPQATYLSNFVANLAKAEIIRTIVPDAFYPKPGVDSSLLHIELQSKPHIKDSKRFEGFLHRGFSQPRKMLNKQFPAETLQKVGIDPQRRAQTLNFNEWIKLFKGDGASAKATPPQPQRNNVS
jgi:16S rRNA (adenine1518-N6/adenine1519-N6)-dimethyltransferase